MEKRFKHLRYIVCFFNIFFLKCKYMRSLVAFLFGIYIGQEYGRLIPNLKNESIKLYEKLEHELNTFNEDVVRRQGNKK